jgi:hypothetical protein
MTTDQQKKRAEEAEKIIIIESHIEMSIEHLGARLSAKRKDGLKRMTKPELQQLARSLKGDSLSAQDAVNKVDAATYASDAERRRAEDAKLDTICGPAKVDMRLW